MYQSLLYEHPRVYMKLNFTTVKHNLKSMLRANCNNLSCWASIIWWHRELVLLQKLQAWRCNLCFHNWKVQAHTNPRSQTKRTRSSNVVGSFHYPYKCLYFERMDVFSPYLRIMVSCYSWNGYIYIIAGTTTLPNLTSFLVSLIMSTAGEYSLKDWFIIILIYKGKERI